MFQRVAVGLFADAALLIPVFLRVNVFRQQLMSFSTFIACFSQSCRRIGAKTQRSAFFGVRAVVVENLQLGAVGLYPQRQTVAIDQVEFLVFGLGLLNFSIGEWFSCSGHL